ncbi:MAG: class I SAM-dependent methyltransferase [Nitrospinae bacterium]|nr:class I SAM-dependent methyltransferase [Nitrospinota bacterium]
MKTTILLEEIFQSDLRPLEKYTEYEELLREDALTFLQGNDSAWEMRPCPGCGKGDLPDSFIKDSFNYKKCPGCLSIFVSPIPKQEILGKLRSEGKGTAFRKKMFEETLSITRYQHILLEQLQWITMTLDELGVSAMKYFDFYSNDSGWMKLVSEKEKFESLVSISPQEPLDACNEIPGVDITSDFRIQGKAEIVSAFGVLDKVSDPLGLLNKMVDHLAGNGVLFISTTTSGFEYQILGEKAPSLIPLDRLTLFSIEAIKNLLEKRGLEVIEMSTPGRLDVEMVNGYFKGKTSSETHAFWDYFFTLGDHQAFADLQTFLQKHRLSSHLRLSTKRKA